MIDPCRSSSYFRVRGQAGGGNHQCHHVVWSRPSLLSSFSKLSKANWDLSLQQVTVHNKENTKQKKQIVDAEEEKKNLARRIFPF